MGEKGSLKNLYKSFRFFLANNKKKKKEKLLEKKKKEDNNKLKSKFKLSFFVVLTTIFGFFSSIFSNDKKNKIEVKEITNASDILKVKSIVVNIEKDIKKAKNIDNIEKCKVKLDNTSKAVEEAKLFLPEVIALKDAIKKVNIKADDKIEQIKLVEKKKSNICIIELTKQEKIETVNKNLFAIKDKVNEIKIKLLEVVTIKEILEFKKEIEDLQGMLKLDDFNKEDIKKIDQFLLLYDTKELKILTVVVDDKLKKEAEQLELKLKKNDITIEDIIKIDALLLLYAYDTKELRILKTKIDEKLNETPDKQEEIINDNVLEEIITVSEIKQVTHQQEQKLTTKELVKEKEKIQEKKEEVKEKVESSLATDIKMTTLIVDRQIVSMDYKVSEIRKARNNKPIFFLKMQSMVSNTLKLCASISPFFFFKNKIVGTFTSAILLNNSIRSLRKSISENKKDVSYLRTNRLELIIKEHKEIEEKTKDIFNDSFNQLSIFKNDFISKYGIYINDNIEIQNMMNEIYSIEEYIISKQNEYRKENEQIKIKLRRNEHL